MGAGETTRDTKIIADFFKQHGKALSFKKGRRVPATEMESRMLYLKSGYAVAYLAAPSIKRAYYTYGPADIIQFGQLTNTTGGSLTYVALTNLVLYSVPSALMWRAIDKRPDMAIALMRQVIRYNEFHARRIENLSYRYASDKLTYRILNLAERFGTAKDGKIYIRVPVTHRALGMFVNMARESVSREIEKLVTKGLISYNRQRIVILEPEKLVKSLHETIRTDWSTILTMVTPKN
jgi:CRP-like cAMP-binding protein